MRQLVRQLINTAAFDVFVASFLSGFILSAFMSAAVRDWAYLVLVFAASVLLAAVLYKLGTEIMKVITGCESDELRNREL